MGVTQVSIFGPVLFTLYVKRASLSTEEVRRAMGYVDKLLLAHLSPSDISVAISDLNQQ